MIDYKNMKEYENARYEDHVEAIANLRRARARNKGCSSRQLRVWMDGRIKMHQQAMEKV